MLEKWVVGIQLARKIFMVHVNLFHTLQLLHYNCQSNCSNRGGKLVSRRMPGNIEIKARIKDVNDIIVRAQSMPNEHIQLEQSDTFFNVLNKCRLKLRYEKDRISGEETACLIAYERPDVIGPKFCNYVKTPVPDAESMEKALEMSNGIQGKVEKQRDVFIVSRNNLKSRVHVDVVKNLGDFLEFEVIVENDNQLEEAKDFAEYLSKHFGISEEDHIAGAYWNLLQAKT